MKITIALRLHENDISRFDNAKFLITEKEIDNYTEYGKNLLIEHNSYDKALEILFNNGYQKIYTDDIDFFKGEYIYLFGKKDEWYIAKERPDNEVYFYSLRDFIYE